MSEELTAASPAADSNEASAASQPFPLAAQDVGPSVAADASASSDANSAQSSGADAQGAKSEHDKLLEITKSALQKTADQGASPDPKAEPGAKPAAGVQPKEGAESDEQLPFHKHPRWQQITAQHKELTAQVETLRAPAEQYQRIEGFMQANDLSPQDAAQGFKIMALIRRDPEGALRELMPYVTQLREVVGEILPADLQAKVDEGAIDQATAREFARTRVTAAAHQGRAEQATRQVQTIEEQRQADLAQAVANSISTAVNGWEEQTSKSDPDYAMKKEMVRDRVFALVQETGKRPRTPEEGVALARQAYEDVNKRLRSVRPTRSVGATPSPSSRSSAAAPAPLAPNADPLAITKRALGLA